MAENVKKQYLDLEGLQTLWSKIKAADTANAELIKSSNDKINEEISKLSGRVDKHDGEIESLWDTVNQLEAGGTPGEITYIEIKRENDDYIGESTKAPTTSSVVSALNSIEDKVDSIQLGDYYKKEEIDEMFDSISEEDINNLK